MTYSQKVIVKKWLWYGIAIVVMCGIGAFVFEMGATYTPGLGVGLWLALNRFSDDSRRGSNAFSLGEFLQEKPGLKLWIVIYCMVVLPFLIYRIYHAAGEVFGLFILSLVLLVVPIIVVQEISRYLEAGKDA
jgi:hypothetical protein